MSFVCCVGSVVFCACWFRCDLCDLAPLCPLSDMLSPLYVVCVVIAPLCRNLKGRADLITIMIPGIPADSGRQACSGLDE